MPVARAFQPEHPAAGTWPPSPLKGERGRGGGVKVPVGSGGLEPRMNTNGHE